MKYTEYKSGNDLSDCIESFWSMKSTDCESEFTDTMKCFSPGMIELIFHIDNCRSYCFFNNEWMEYPSCYVVGINESTTVWRMSTNSVLFGIRIKPEAISEFFRENIYPLNFYFENAERVLHEELIGLIYKIRKSSNDQERIQLVEEFVKAGFMNEDKRGRGFFTYVEKLRQHPDFEMSSLYEDLNMSVRQFQRLFKKYFGISPKAYQNLIRVYHAHQLRTSGNSDLLDIGLSTGHYDSSHFNKNFKTFFGSSPRSYFNEYKDKLEVEI